jgi:hypothetical protein
VKSTTPSKRPGRERGPLSVPLTPDLRARLVAQAKKRKLKVATTARMLLDERLAALEDVEALSAAEEWQRAQAWATWDKIVAGEVEDVPLERFAEHAARAIDTVRSRKRRGP